MERLQREHIDAVMRLAGDGRPLPPDAAGMPDPLIAESWSRCVHQHRLDPTRLQEAVILPQPRVREHQERLESFLHIARHGLEALYREVAGLGYCVLLTDARGVTVDFIGDLQLDATLRRAGLTLGSDWSEHHAGTCGVGTAIATAQALTVHQGDHFDATHIPLTCTAAPLYDPLGRLTAILDISALTSPQAKRSQHLALQLVKLYAQRVEDAHFLRCHRQDWVLKLHPSPEFVEISPDHLLALDGRGHIVGHNRAAQLLLLAEQRAGLRADGAWGGSAAGAPGVPGPGAPGCVLGLPFEQFFNARLQDLGRYLRARPGEQRALTLARSGRVLFLHAVPPSSRWAVAGTDEGATAGRIGGVADGAADGADDGAVKGTPVDPAPAVAGARAAGAAAAAPAVPAALAALSGGDAALDRQIQRAARLVDTPLGLLITGETGCGKEYFAKAVHQASQRRARPFVAVNCAAIPETLIESELFGHLPGSFSGARLKGKSGLIQAADGGTLFLDEIGDMPLPLQARLLRVLAEREVLPIGAIRAQKVDVRVIAATHADLAALVRAGRFRDDLYYRLAGAHLALPPLRARQDLPWLLHRLLRDGADGPPPRLAAEAEAWLRAHRWPGNLRELKNVLDYARAMAGPGGLIGVAELPDTLVDALRAALSQAAADARKGVRAGAMAGGMGGGPARSGTGASAGALPGATSGAITGALRGTITAHTTGRTDGLTVGRTAGLDTDPDNSPEGGRLLLQHLRAAHWNVSAVAHQLGVARMTVYRRMQRWGIQPPWRGESLPGAVDTPDTPAEPVIDGRRGG